MAIELEQYAHGHEQFIAAGQVQFETSTHAARSRHVCCLVQVQAA